MTTASRFDRRRQHIGRYMLDANRRFQETALIELRAMGHDSLTSAMISILPHCDAEGTPMAILVERSWVTKQAMGQLIREFERVGYVTREADPGDGRAVVVQFTARGIRLLDDVVEVLNLIEQRYALILGENGLRDLQHLLQRLCENASNLAVNH
jgi:DNA-binding MarR family transcriptional regulator